MISPVSVRSVSFVAGLVLLVVACRPPEPPPLVAEDLGTADRPLLPSLDPSVSLDPSILSGRAAPVEPDDLLEEAEADEPAERAEADDGALADVREALEEIIELTVESVADDALGDLTDLIVPEQQEQAGRLLELAARLIEEGNRLEAVLTEKAPQMMQSLQAMGAGMLPGAVPGGLQGLSGDQEANTEALVRFLQVGDIELLSADQAVATIGPEGQGVPVEFRLVDEEWYVYVPKLLDDQELLDGVLRVGEIVSAKLTDVTARIEDGSLAPEAIMAEFAMFGVELQPVLTELKPKFDALAAELVGAGAGASSDQEGAAPDEEEGTDEQAPAEEPADDSIEDEEADEEPEEPAPPRGRGRGRGRA